MTPADDIETARAVLAAKRARAQQNAIAGKPHLSEAMKRKGLVEHAISEYREQQALIASQLRQACSLLEHPVNRALLRTGIDDRDVRQLQHLCALRYGSNAALCKLYMYWHAGRIPAVRIAARVGIEYANLCTALRYSTEENDQ